MRARRSGCGALRSLSQRFTAAKDTPSFAANSCCVSPIALRNFLISSPVIPILNQIQEHFAIFYDICYITFYTNSVTRPFLGQSGFPYQKREKSPRCVGSPRAPQRLQTSCYCLQPW